MNYEFENMVNKMQCGFICVLDGKSEEFSSAEEYMKSNFEKRCKITSIDTRDGKIVLNLERMAVPNDLNADWVKQNEKQFGTMPEFF